MLSTKQDNDKNINITFFYTELTIKYNIYTHNYNHIVLIKCLDTNYKTITDHKYAGRQESPTRG